MRWFSLFCAITVLALVLPDIGTGKGKKDAKTSEINRAPPRENANPPHCAQVIPGQRSREMADGEFEEVRTFLLFLV